MTTILEAYQLASTLVQRTAVKYGSGISSSGYMDKVGRVFSEVGLGYSAGTELYTLGISSPKAFNTKISGLIQGVTPTTETIYNQVDLSTGGFAVTPYNKTGKTYSIQPVADAATSSLLGGLLNAAQTGYNVATGLFTNPLGTIFGDNPDTTIPGAIEKYTNGGTTSDEVTKNIWNFFTPNQQDKGQITAPPVIQNLTSGLNGIFAGMSITTIAILGFGAVYLLKK